MASRTVRATCTVSVADAASGLLLLRLVAVGRAVTAVSAKNPRAEAVHRLRVSARRASATITAFRSLIPRRQRRWFKNSLRRMRHAAGEARDLDVFAARCRESSSAQASGAGATARRRLTQLLEKKRPETRRGLGAGIADLRTPEWEAQSAAVVAAVASAKTTETIAAFADRRSRRFVSRFLARLDHRLRDDRDIHRLRIETKKLRYVLEAFAAGMPPSASAACDRTLRRLQTRLGEFTDHAAAAERLRLWLRREEFARVRQTLVAARRQESASAKRARRDCIRWWTASRREAIARQLRRTLEGKTA